MLNNNNDSKEQTKSIGVATMIAGLSSPLLSSPLFSFLLSSPPLFSLSSSPLISPLLSSPLLSPLSSPLFFSILFSFLLSSSLLSSFYFCLSATQSLIPQPFGPIHSLDSEAHTPTNTQALPPFYPCPKSRKKDKKILYGRR